MSTVDRPQPRVLPPLEDGQRLDQPTFHERYSAMSEEIRAELIGGVVFMASPLRDPHGDADRNIGGWLFHYARFTPGLRSPSNATIILGPDAEVQPDAQLRLSEAVEGLVRMIDGYAHGSPELVIEIGDSSRSKDLGAKKAMYERAGVPEYLFVGVEPEEVRWFILRERTYREITPDEDGVFRSEIFPGLWLDPKALFEEDRNGLIATLERGLASDEHARFVADLRARGA
jgi:Uma2 family endonuclease